MLVNQAGNHGSCRGERLPWIHSHSHERLTGVPLTTSWPDESGSARSARGFGEHGSAQREVPLGSLDSGRATILVQCDPWNGHSCGTRLRTPWRWRSAPVNNNSSSNSNNLNNSNNDTMQTTKDMTSTTIHSHGNTRPAQPQALVQRP